MVNGHVTFAVPGDLATPTGGYAYDRRVIGELRSLGWEVSVLDLGENFPKPGADALVRAGAQLKAAKAGAVIVDGLALGVLPDAAKDLSRTHALVALVHHPLALETGVAPADAVALRISERAALDCARHVITTSPTTSGIVQRDYAVTADRLTTAPPGNDVVAWSEGSGGSTVRILSVGSIVPRKGYDVLIDALATLRDLPWHLEIVGDPTRSPQTAAAIEQQIARRELGDRVILRGALIDDDLATSYRTADIFVLASHYEGYGMAASEAIAYGLPVVATDGGALGPTVAGAGIIVKPGDAAALAGALKSLVSDASARLDARDRARAASTKLPTWRAAGEAFARVLTAVS